MQRRHKHCVKKIAHESLHTLIERFYFWLSLMFDNKFRFYVALFENAVVGFISVIDTHRDGLVVVNIAVASMRQKKAWHLYCLTLS